MDICGPRSARDPSALALVKGRCIWQSLSALLIHVCTRMNPAVHGDPPTTCNGICQQEIAQRSYARSHTQSGIRSLLSNPDFMKKGNKDPQAWAESGVILATCLRGSCSTLLSSGLRFDLAPIAIAGHSSDVFWHLAHSSTSSALQYRWQHFLFHHAPVRNYEHYELRSLMKHCSLVCLRARLHQPCSSP